MRETVPDSIFEQADEVELVDLPPDDLIERLREGKVYVPQQAVCAIDHFFQKGNLIALRELCFRKSLSASMRKWRRIAASIRSKGPGRSPSGSSSASGQARCRRAWLCARDGWPPVSAPWIARDVESPTAPQLSQADEERLNHTLAPASQLGAETVTLSGTSAAEAIIQDGEIAM